MMRFLSIVSAILFMCLASVGCGSNSQQSTASDEVAHPSLGMTFDEFKSKFNKYAKEYSKEYDIGDPIQITEKTQLATRTRQNEFP